MKKVLVMILAILLFGLSGCTRKPLDPAVLEYGSIINEQAEGKPIVEIRGDNAQKLYVFDISEMNNNIELLIDREIKQGYLYVTMAGDVTEHTLESDGSLFDGIARISDNRAEFSVTYEGEKKIKFVIKIKS